MSDFLIRINGKEIEKQKACVPINSDSFLFGRAVFETLRTYGGKWFRREDHLNRLMESAKILELENLWSTENIGSELEMIEQNLPWTEARIRIILTDGEVITITEKLEEKPNWMYEKGVELSWFTGQRNLPLAKQLGDTLCSTANREAKKKGCYDAILANEQGWVKECAYANIFWVKDGRLFTTDEGILKGITRETILELAGECEFEEIQKEELLKADEVFLTQSTSGILPVIAIEGNKIGKGKPGKMTQELREKWRRKFELNELIR